MIPNTPAPHLAIKQLSQPPQSIAINRRLVRGSHAATYRFIKHPGRNATGRVVWHSDIDDVSASTGDTAHFEFLPVEWVVGIEDPRNPSDVGSVERASWSSAISRCRRSKAPSAACAAGW